MIFASRVKDFGTPWPPGKASGGDPGGDPGGQFWADPVYTNGGSAHETQNVHVTGPPCVHRLKHQFIMQKVASRVGETPPKKVGCNSV